MSETPEQLAMAAASNAVGKVLASAKNPRTLLGKKRASSVAYAATFTAIETYTGTLAHERARNAGTACAQCGQFPEGMIGQ